MNLSKFVVTKPFLAKAISQVSVTFHEFVSSTTRYLFAVEGYLPGMGEIARRVYNLVKNRVETAQRRLRSSISF